MRLPASRGILGYAAPCGQSIRGRSPDPHGRKGNTMAEESMGLANVDVKTTLSAENRSFFSSLASNTLQEKARLYNAISNPAHQTGDCIGETILVTDVIVEIINPKHHDIVNSYSVNNVVISNRYISKMITQIGEKEAIFNFYSDILTYDEAGSTEYDSKEIYVKKVSRFFEELPPPCTAEAFIRGVFYASADEAIPAEKRNPNMPLGYVKPGGKIVLFSGDQSQTMVHLEPRDKIIVFSNH